MKIQIILILFTTILFSVAVKADFNYDSYKPSSINDAITTLDPESLKNDWFFEAAHSKFKVNVTYTGQHREIENKSLEFIKNWVKTFRHPREYENLFPFEIEVIEKGKKYWLPLQSGLVDTFANEVKDNENVELYLMLIGGYKFNPILTINEFKAK